MARISLCLARMTRATTHKAVLLMALSFAACHCERHTLEPSLNTVDPSTHEPYQHRTPQTSARPLYDAALGSAEAPP